MLRIDNKVFAPMITRALPVREVEMEVVFGTPSKNCEGTGVCLLTERLPKRHIITCPHAPVIIHYPPGRELIFRFIKSHLTEAVVEQYFNTNHFLVEEAFRLPLPLVRRWRLPVRLVKPGHYLLEEYSREWRLYIPL